jgi:hypothetical protein
VPLGNRGRRRSGRRAAAASPGPSQPVPGVLTVARDVLAVRLSDDERKALERAAAKGRITLSAFLRWAGLLMAQRLEHADDREPEPARVRPVKAPPPAVAVPHLGNPPFEPHVVNTYASFEQYRAERYGGGIGLGPGIREEYL